MKKIFIAFLSIVLLNSACDNIDFGDTDENVNGPSDVNTASMLSGAMTNFGDDRGRPYRITPTLYVQYLVQYVYNDEMLYANSAGYWSSYYVQELSNLQEVIDVLDDPESASSSSVLANGSIENQKAVALIWKSLIFKRVTDLFGNVPYSEALNTDILTPAYDAQADIYSGMISEVKSARDMIDVSADGATGDVIYSGDMELWQKFANSFLLSLGMQLTKVDAALAEATVTEALSNEYGVLESVSEDALFTYDVDNDFTNPWNWMRSADYGVSAEFISALKGNGFTSNTTYDERINYVTDIPSASGHAYGYNSYTDTENTATVGSVIIAAATQLPILTSAYTYFHRAEAAARGWTDEDPAEMLKLGIMASYERANSIYSVEIGDGADYADARVTDMGTAGELTVIAEEKWVDLFPLGFDSWAEWRRTGIPTLTPAADAVNDGQIPRRYNYPNSEPSLNGDGYASGVSALSPATDDNTSRFWWDQE